jgi:hypothetical protein
LFGIDLVQVSFQIIAKYSPSHSMSTCSLYDEETLVFLSHACYKRTSEITESLLFRVCYRKNGEYKELLF